MIEGIVSALIPQTQQLQPPMRIVQGWGNKSSLNEYLCNLEFEVECVQGCKSLHDTYLLYRLKSRTAGSCLRKLDPQGYKPQTFRLLLHCYGCYGKTR